MSLYTIYYEFLDKRGCIHSKKILCNGKDRVREKCIELEKLEIHKPIREPMILITTGVNQYENSISYEEIMRGDDNAKNKRRLI